MRTRQLLEVLSLFFRLRSTLNQYYLIILFFFINISALASEFVIKAKTAILQDFLSGEILYEKEPDLSIFPASMTKIMTSIIAFDLIKKGQLSLDEKFFVSENAWINYFTYIRT